MARTLFNIMVLIIFLIGTAVGMANNYDKFLDQNTPLNEPLRGIYKKSFAYHSLMHRMPDVFTATIDSLRSEKFDLDASKKVNDFVDELKLLLSEILANKSLRKICGTSILTMTWNQILHEQFDLNSTVTWFETGWLFTENYLYMRIKEIFETKTFHNYDPFKQLKDKAFDESEETMIAIAKFLILEFSKKEDAKVDNSKLYILFLKMIKLSLWGNRFDLSLNIGKANNISGDPLDTIVSLDQYVLADHSEQIWNTLNLLNHHNKKIDIILDNSAYELFTDLCLADFFITFGYADTIVFHGKSIPWYVSDVTKQDFEQLLNRLENECTSSALQQLGKRWNSYYKAGSFKIECEDFWTLPFDYSKMATHDTDLYNKLASSHMLIFKGDLNYRKLIGDINWSPTTTFRHALRGFQPSAVVALRTLKCDCVCGLSPGYENHIKENHKEHNYISSTNYWQVNGKYGVVQLSR